MNPQAFTDATITETVMALKSHNKTAFSRWLEATYLPDEECPPQPQGAECATPKSAETEERRVPYPAERIMPGAAERTMPDTAERRVPYRKVTDRSSPRCVAPPQINHRFFLLLLPLYYLYFFLLFFHFIFIVMKKIHHVLPPKNHQHGVDV